jgi:hypothetical protein
MRGRWKRATAQRACALLYRSPWLLLGIRSRTCRIALYTGPLSWTVRVGLGIQRPLPAHNPAGAAQVATLCRVGSDMWRFWKMTVRGLSPTDEVR